MSFGAPTVTGYSPFYSSTAGITGSGNEASYNAMARYGRSSTERAVAVAMIRHGFRAMRRAVISLNGAAPGGSTTESVKRVQAQTPFNSLTYGGARTVETHILSSGVTTSAMESYIDSKMLRDGRYAGHVVTNGSLGYPTDRSGNGGGSKVGR
jgi:hypothetical protein